MPLPLRATLVAPAVALAVLVGVPVAAGAAAPTAVAAPAPASEVAQARAEVTDLDAEVARTTAELTAGTVRLDEGRARLAETQARAAAARVAADLALARAAQARAVLARVVNAEYRTSRPDSLTRALAAQPDRLGEVVLADAELDHVRGNQADALEEAARQSALAQQLVTEADALQAQAAAQTAELEAQVAALTASAQASRTRLEAAAARLQAAQAAQAAADQAARDAAARQTLTDISGGAALCNAPSSSSGYANGFLPPSVLCPIAVGNGHRLRADAAAAFNALLAVRPLCLTDSYRSYGAQVDVYARKPDLAAIPGTSNHGLGIAVDLCGGIETFGTEPYQWMKANAPKYGWVHPAWAEPGGSRPEPWHWEFVGSPAS